MNAGRPTDPRIPFRGGVRSRSPLQTLDAPLSLVARGVAGG
jgi:hypothetical protein